MTIPRDLEAAAQSEGQQLQQHGAAMQNQGVTQGPQEQELNSKGGYVVSDPTLEAKQPDNRTPSEQAKEQGARLQAAGVTQDPQQAAQASRVDTALANAQSSVQNAPTQQQTPGVER